MVWKLVKKLFGSGPTGSGNCPACKDPLGSETYEGVQIDRCPTCSGTWCDAGELDTIIERKDETINARLIVKFKVMRDWKAAAGEKASDRVCPRCDGKMTSINYKQVPGLVIERCDATCGVWLDKGELEKIQAFEESR